MVANTKAILEFSLIVQFATQSVSFMKMGLLLLCYKEPASRSGESKD